MQKVFQYAMDPPTHVVMGVRLQPLTLGHVWLLHKYTDVYRDADPTIGSLIVACTICMLDHKEYHTFCRKWWTPLFLAWWGRKCRTKDFSTEYERMLTYLQDYCEQPEFKMPPNRMRSLGTPWHIRVTAMLMAKLGCARSEAMDMVVIDATALLACVAETEGDVDLWTDENEELWERAKAV